LPGDVYVERSGSQFSIDFYEGVVFSGTITDTTLELSYQHERPWSDGCTWAAIETLSGTYDADCTMTLAYQYVEEVVGSNDFCDAPCGGSSELVLQVVVPEVE
jgi:hypothetical protein